MDYSEVGCLVAQPLGLKMGGGVLLFGNVFKCVAWLHSTASFIQPALKTLKTQFVSFEEDMLTVFRFFVRNDGFRYIRYYLIYRCVVQFRG